MNKLLKFFLPLLLGMVLLFDVQAQDWRQAAVRTFPGISGIFFIDENTGWAVGSSGFIYKTTDAGDTWLVALSDADSVDYSEVYFVDQNLGFAGASEGIVMKTTDGGSSWSKLNANGADGDVLALYALSEDQIWVLANSGSGSAVYNTTDGGVNWQSVLTSSAKLYDMKFDGGTNGIVCGKSNADVYYSSDGVNWNLPTAIPLGGFTYTRSDIRGVYLVNDSVGYAVGWGSLIGLQPSIELKTNDGGASWTYLT